MLSSIITHAICMRLLRMPISVAGFTLLRVGTNETERWAVDFKREWADYKNGFGSLSDEFWAGIYNFFKAGYDS